MARIISFSLTTPQFLAREKDVTRRVGWLNLKAGDLLCAVRQAQGLPLGAKVERLGMIRVKDVRREQLGRLTDDLEYGFDETRREGFVDPHPNAWPSQFVAFFCASHRGVTRDSDVTRIEFERVL